MHTSRNFFARSVDEQNWLTKDTWCDKCGEADLGMIDPVEYEEDSQVVIEGKCVNCGTTVTSLISEEQVKQD